MKIQLLLPLLLFSVVLSNCKKDNDSAPNILISKVWKRGIQDKNTSTNPPGKISYYAVKKCEKDDLFQFNSAGQFILKTGENKCSPDEASKEIQHYTINRETNTLIINGVKYILAEESKEQIKYYTPIPPETSDDYLVFLLQ